jgi:hypothetical protein
VERRHTGELVAPASRSFLRTNWTQTADLPRGVHEAVIGRHQPWRRHGVQGEADQSDEQEPAEGVAPERVATSVEPPQDRERQAHRDEMRDAVVGVEESDQGSMPDQEVLRTALHVQVHPALEPH